MANYFSRDVLAFDDGELDISSGDIQVAGVRQSQRQLLINALNTTRGGYRFEPSFGWAAEYYVGRPSNALTYNAMRQDLQVMFGSLDDMAKEDIYFELAPISTKEDIVGIVVRHSGVFLEPTGIPHTTALTIGWKFSFRTGSIEVEG